MSNETDEHNYGEDVTITVPEQALGLVIERAEIEFNELYDMGVVDQDSLDDIEGALNKTQAAFEEATDNE